MPFIVAIRTAESWTLLNLVAAVLVLDLLLVLALFVIVRRFRRRQ